MPIFFGAPKVVSRPPGMSDGEWERYLRENNVVPSGATYFNGAAISTDGYQVGQSEIDLSASNQGRVAREQAQQTDCSGVNQFRQRPVRKTRFKI